MPLAPRPATSSSLEAACVGRGRTCRPATTRVARAARPAGSPIGGPGRPVGARAAAIRPHPRRQAAPKRPAARSGRSPSGASRWTRPATALPCGFGRAETQRPCGLGWAGCRRLAGPLRAWPEGRVRPTPVGLAGAATARRAVALPRSVALPGSVTTLPGGWVSTRPRSIAAMAGVAMVTIGGLAATAIDLGRVLTDPGRVVTDPGRATDRGRATARDRAVAAPADPTAVGRTDPSGHARRARQPAAAGPPKGAGRISSARPTARQSRGAGRRHSASQGNATRQRGSGQNAPPDGFPAAHRGGLPAGCGRIAAARAPTGPAGPARRWDARRAGRRATCVVARRQFRPRPTQSCLVPTRSWSPAGARWRRRSRPAARRCGCWSSRNAARRSTSWSIHATTLRIPVVEVEGGSLTALAGFDGHQGVALVAKPRAAGRRSTTILARARQRGAAPFVLVLDSLEDPQNFGTLLRSAEASGVHGVIYPTRRAAPLSAGRDQGRPRAPPSTCCWRPVDDLAGDAGRPARARAAHRRRRRGRVAQLLARPTCAARWRSSSAARARASPASAAAARPGGAHPDARQDRVAQRRRRRLGPALRRRPAASGRRRPATDCRPPRPDEPPAEADAKPKRKAPTGRRRPRPTRRPSRRRAGRVPSRWRSQAATTAEGRRVGRATRSCCPTEPDRRRCARRLRARARRRCILRRRAAVAQLVEQRFCKPPVPGSSPVGGSTEDN